MPLPFGRRSKSGANPPGPASVEGPSPPLPSAGPEAAPAAPAAPAGSAGALRALAAGRYRSVAASRDDAAGRLARELEVRAHGVLRHFVAAIRSSAEADDLAGAVRRERRLIDEGLEAAAAASAELGATSDHVADRCRAAEKRTRAAAARAEQAHEHCATGRRALGALAESVRTTAETSALLERSFEELRRVAKRIGNIAEQIDLLALNAGIQAARAGVGGERLQVVAAEVKNLARETSAATEAVRTTVDRVGPELEVLAAIAERSVAAARSGCETLECLGAHVDAASHEAEQAAIAAGEIAVGTRQQSAAAQVLAAELERARAASGELKHRCSRLDLATAEVTEAALQGVDELGRLELAGFAPLAARADLALWRQRLATACAGDDAALLGLRADASRRRLERWLATADDPGLTGRPEWRELLAAHGAAQKAGRELAAALERGDRDGARARLAAVDTAVADVLRLLDVVAA